MAEARVPPRSVLFAPDSGEEIGGGHVMRCLTLGRALAGRGWRIGLHVGPAGARLVEAFGWRGVQCVPDLEAPAEVVVIDSYRLDVAAEAPLRAAGRRVAVIDDLADRAHACDLLVDMSLGRRAEDYAGLAPGARVLAGPDYALVRSGFAAARAGSLARRDGRPVRRALVSLGLTDVGGVTAKVVEALAPALGAIELDVVVGRGAVSLPRLTELAKVDRRIGLHVDCTDMEGLMSEADLAVGAGGSSTWERACMGLPALTLVLADNQAAMAEAFERRGLTLAVEARADAPASGVPAAWRRLVEDGRLRQALAERSARLCDGLGAGRVADALEDLVQCPSSGSAEP